MSKLTEEINNLLQTFKKLRDPSQGCPWDKEQDFKSIASCSIEEAYEVADAIEREDFNDLKEELGDLLLQVVHNFQSTGQPYYQILSFQFLILAVILHQRKFL